MATSPKYAKPSFDCPYCNAFAQQKWRWLVASDPMDDEQGLLYPGKLRRGHTEQEYKLLFSKSELVQSLTAMQTNILRPDLPKSIEFRRLELGVTSVNGEKLGVCNMMLSECQACKRVAVWEHETLVHPTAISNAPQASDDMPENVKEIYNEARAIAEVSPRAASALLRLCLEELLKHLNVAEGKLDSMIGSLVEEGVEEELQQAMDILRLCGNDGIHRHIGEIDLSEHQDAKELLFKLINVAVKELITRPNYLKTIYSNMPENKRRGIDQRDSKKK